MEESTITTPIPLRTAGWGQSAAPTAQEIASWEGKNLRERDFQRWVIEVARLHKWKVWHVPAPMRWDSQGGKGFVGARDAAGLADLVLVGKNRVIFAEVKGTGGKLSEKQQEFLHAVNYIESEDVVAYSWWPGDEAAVEKILAGP